ncbi:NADP-dependent oxidoreductase [Parafrankia sp. FMc2]|uniref:NADP-dependent oxidoreductase n=1 Tax=Parafrankia sp. FMc2 TaxID=3233196 RepID=UPI0034D65A38
MRAAVVHRFGPPGVLGVALLPAPHAGPGEVRVRVRVAGVQHFDLGVRAGEFPREFVGDPPIVPGNEFAGVIDEVGADVTGPRVGDEVLGFSTLGAYAEHIVVPAGQVVRKPPAVPWDVAGGFPGHAQGARNVLSRMRVTGGETVLINAAAGGLGAIAAQLARIRGAATVIGTASPANHEYVRSLGAIPVAYGPGLTDRVRNIAPAGIDAAFGFEVEGLRTAVELARDVGRVVTMIFNDEIAALGVSDWAGTRSTRGLREMVEYVERGDLSVAIRSRYRLEDAASAHRDLESGHGRGKIVIEI